MAAAPIWSKPYYGVQHLGAKSPRCSVTDYGKFSTLHCWYRGCGFSPIESDHDTAAEAREAGEKWLKEQQ